MATTIQVMIPQGIQATISYHGLLYHYNDKWGRRLSNGSLVFEYRCLDGGRDYRVWALADGSEVEAD